VVLPSPEALSAGVAAPSPSPSAWVSAATTAPCCTCAPAGAPLKYNKCVKRDLPYMKRDLSFMKRDLLNMKRDLPYDISKRRDLPYMKRDLSFMKRDLLNMKRDLPYDISKRLIIFETRTIM